MKQYENMQKTLKAQAIIKTLSWKEIDYLNEKHQNANGSKTMADIIIEYNEWKQKNKDKNITDSNQKIKDDDEGRERR